MSALVPLDVSAHDRVQRLRAEAAAERLAALRARDCPLLALARRVAAFFRTAPVHRRPVSVSR